MSNQPRLCFVIGDWAYFTTLPLDETSGDDWNDVPYEHNAEPPAGDHIVKVAWDGDLCEPCDGTLNSEFSVDDINAGAVAWLRTGAARDGPRVVIPAGTTLERFKELVRLAGGHVYTTERT